LPLPRSRRWSEWIMEEAKGEEEHEL